MTEQKCFWDEDYQGKCVDSPIVLGPKDKISRLITMIEEIEGQGSHVAGLKIVGSSIQIITSIEENAPEGT